MSDSGAAQRAKARAEAEREHDAEQRQEAEAKESKQAEKARYQLMNADERLMCGYARFPNLLDDASDPSTWLGVSIMGTGMVSVALAFVQLTAKKKDPAFDAGARIVLVLLAITFVVLLAFRQTMVMSAKRAWEAEKRWMAQLPFPVENAILVLGEFYKDRALALEVHFVSGSTELVEQARERMTGVDPGGWVRNKEPYLEVGARPAGSEKREKVEVSRDARLLFHDMIEVILLPLHGQEPIARVVVREEL